MKNNKKGFTLVELVIVVAVMAILVAVAIPAISTITETAEEQVSASNCRTIESLMKLAEAEAEAEGTTVAYAEKLSEAKLGITDGTYYYDTATGKVNAETQPDAGYIIAFSEPSETQPDELGENASYASGVTVTTIVAEDEE